MDEGLMVVTGDHVDWNFTVIFRMLCFVIDLIQCDCDCENIFNPPLCKIIRDYLIADGPSDLNINFELIMIKLIMKIFFSSVCL